MKRMSTTGLVLVSLLALTATASAEPAATGPETNNGGAQLSARWQYENWQAKREFYRKLAKKFHTHEPIPIDPGRGDGRVPVEPQPVEPQPPQGPPGFIWVNGHWERVRAPQGSTVVVRDHRTVAPHGGWQDVSSSPGGVTVTQSPRWPNRRPTVYGGVQVRDHRTVTTNGSDNAWVRVYGGRQVLYHRQSGNADR